MSINKGVQAMKLSMLLFVATALSGLMGIGIIVGMAGFEATIPAILTGVGFATAGLFAALLVTGIFISITAAFKSLTAKEIL
jgi:hypothetical protein